MNQLYPCTRFLLLIVFCFFHAIVGFSQIPTIQDCLGAIPVCQQTYSESNSPSGQGNYQNEVNSMFTCLSGEDNSVWYTFTVNESGNFGFLLTPNSPTDDYDWALYNITNADCSQINTNPNLLVSCNAAGGGTCNGATGATGGTSYNIQGAGCSTNPPNLNFGYTAENALISVVEGNTYVLMVANWTGSPFGYTIDFGVSDVGIFDFENPEIEQVNFPENCTTDEIEISFSENINCSSAQPSSFVLTGPGGPFTITAISNNCSLGGLYDKEFTLTTDPPITESGAYTLTVCCVLDVCENKLPLETFNFDFTLIPEPTVDLGVDTSFCIGTVLSYDVTNVQSTYLWQDGSTNPTYSISQTGDYAVTVSNACGTSTDEITIISIEFPPMTDLGTDTVLCTGETMLLDAFSEASTYSWSNGQTSSTYTVVSEEIVGVSVTNACGTTTDEIKVDYTAPILLDLPANLTPCSFDTVIFDVSSDTAEYIWENGSVDPIRTIETNGIYSVTVSNHCEIVEGSVSVEFIFPPIIDLGDDQILCDGETTILDATFLGSDYSWQDGRTSPTYEVNSDGIYIVNVENDCGIFIDSVDVSYVPFLDLELGKDAYFCNGPVLLEAGPANDFASPQWQNGLRTHTFLAQTPGTYWLVLDSGCEVKSDTITLYPCEYCEVFMPNAFSPNDDGINDFFQPFTPCSKMDNFNMKVFDRWGGQLYDSGIGLPGIWDGTARGQKLPVGVYLWMVSFDVTLNGEMFSRQMEGSVNLLR